MSIINSSFSTGSFSSLFKFAKVTPIHKKVDKSACNNCRPISLFSNISKIIEIFAYYIYSYFESNNILYDFQFSFQKKSLRNM